MPTQWIDFRGLKKQVPIREVLARYGFLEGLREGKQGRLSGPCPIHGGGPDSNSFHADPTKNVWNCFSDCNGGGNVLDLVMAVDHCTIREAAEKLCEWFGLSFDREQHNRTKKAERGPSAPTAGHTARSDATSRTGDVVNAPLERSLTLNHDHRYLFERGLTVETIKKFGIGYCNRGLLRGRIAIPIQDERGVLVAYAGRAVDDALAKDKGKYKLPSNFAKSCVLYNLNRAHAHVAERGLIVVEGFFGAMRVHQAGFENVVALMGSTLSEEQERLLVAHADRLILMFDGDAAGVTCTREFYGKLRRTMFLKEIHLEAEEQPDSLPDERLRALLAS